ncbi:MAG: hypothetical protein IT294_10475 [Deltaproteobacteria bacterium]|nr:hypothetical protein [Deltaproteobacteria bacterium]
MPPDAPPIAGLVLVVGQFAPGADPTPALAALAAARRVLVRPPEVATPPVPPGVELVVERAYDRTVMATRARRDPTELVVVLLDDERPSDRLGTALAEVAGDRAATGCWASARRIAFLDREIPAEDATIAWRGGGSQDGAPRRLSGYLGTVPATITETIGRLQALAVSARRTAPVGADDFLRRPLAALARRVWRRRGVGMPGLVLSIVETYGEVLRAAQAWEREGIAARRAERQSGVPAGFHFWRTPWGSLTLRDGTPPALRTALLDATPAVVAGMPLAGGRGAVWAVDLADGERGVLRWYRRGGAIRHLVYDRYFGWTPRPIRELAVTHAVIERGVPAPEVLAARVDRLPWGWYRGAIVTREVRDAATFADVLRRTRAPEERARVLAAVGRAVRDLHDRGVHHRDLNANNILVREPWAVPAVSFIDFDRAEVRRALGAGTRRRELRRLARSLRKLARGGMTLAADDIERLQQAYTAGARA